MKKYNMHVSPQMMGPGFKLARAYVPFQVMDKIYEPWKGLMRGTIFPELYDPYPKKKRSEED
ncbi:spore coat associated protein CotJA [Lutispora thermophila]|uniref:Spore coat associated protein JA (CotJA) n=1 Tax=Lutispora thermophila DSM 19022 TaxID=1122184 RepID=A0A1M6CEV2_9FIRM|nr:spore coat associated protein CotJA [Lutispora thermophila]SHI59550.1 Spore coat associated protein JA (CotJA) [Lutispora thermophila DSM 19022]